MRGVNRAYFASLARDSEKNNASLSKSAKVCE